MTAPRATRFQFGLIAVITVMAIVAAAFRMLYVQAGPEIALGVAAPIGFWLMLPLAGALIGFCLDPRDRHSLERGAIVGLVLGTLLLPLGCCFLMTLIDGLPF
jgi:hypothetical protein